MLFNSNRRPLSAFLGFLCGVLGETSVLAETLAPATSTTAATSAPSSVEQPQTDSEAGLSLGRWTPSAFVRLEVIEPRLEKKFPSVPVASQSFLFDLNLTGKKEFSPALTLQADIDAFVRRSWNFRKRNILTQAVETTQDAGEDNPAYRFAINEAYLNGELEHGFQYTAGKKRILWGTGFVANPTDLLNPAKNPLDPTYERRGAWLLQAEKVEESRTYALFFAPAVVEDKNTLPTDVGVFRDVDGERRMHYLVGARLYQLLGGADLNLMAFHGRHFKSEKESDFKAGASWSQIATALSKKLETHAEILVQSGTNRLAPDGESRVEAEQLFFRTLVGLRYDFENESSLVLEYLHQSDGDATGDLETRLRPVGQMLSRRTSAAFPLVPSIVMKNTLYANYQRYKLNDDAFLSWGFAHNLHDHSGWQGPILQWTPNQSLSFTLTANSDYNVTKDTGAEVDGLDRVRLNELNPVQARVGLEVKSYW